MLRGFIYDTPDGKVRLELPATRAGKSTVARYTDGDPTAAEIGVPPPNSLTRPFGIINAVEGEYQYFVPAGSTGSTQTVSLPIYFNMATCRRWHREQHQPDWYPFNRTLAIGTSRRHRPQGVDAWEIDFTFRERSHRP